jgi:hypothetical protein
MLLSGPLEAQLDPSAELTQSLILFWSVLCVVATLFTILTPNVLANGLFFGAICFIGSWWACSRVLGTGELYEGMQSAPLYCGLSFIPVIPTLIYIAIIGNLAKRIRNRPTKPSTATE